MSGATDVKPAGILRKEDIIEEIRARRLILDAAEENVQACSYDMRIGTIFTEKKILRPADGSGVTLDPGAIVSVFTQEALDLPPNIAATAFAINSMSSEGLLVLNPGHVDPGFKGPLTVRAINIRATSKAITFGTPIFTVIFERLPKATAHPYTHNESRDKRENAFHAKDVEQNPESLFKLVTLGKNKPLMTAEEVDRRIIQHWMSITVFAGTVAAVVLALIATIFAVIAVVGSDSDKSKTAISAPSEQRVDDNKQGNSNERLRQTDTVNETSNSNSKSANKAGGR